MACWDLLGDRWVELCSWRSIYLLRRREDMYAKVDESIVHLQKYVPPKVFADDAACAIGTCRAHYNQKHSAKWGEFERTYCTANNKKSNAGTTRDNAEGSMITLPTG